ncbi:hypothetical protein [Nostoc sp.]
MTTTRPPKITHVIGGNKLVPLEDVYSDIGTICGITTLGDDAPPEGSETFSIQALVNNGTVRRAKVRLANKKIRTVYIVAANAPQIGALRGLEYTTDLLIKSAYFPQKYTFGA